MRTYFSSLSVFFVLFALTLSSCKKDDPSIPNEEEVITTLVYILTPVGGTSSTPVVFSFSDSDGDGGAAPVITNGILERNTTYNGVITLFNETVKPSESIHFEVLAEADEHQFFFENTLGKTNISYSDKDADGNPIGLKTELKTTDAEQGAMTVILRHQPDKKASGIVIDDASNAGGETDIEVQFDVVIQ